VASGEALTDKEAWWREFANEFHELCEGMIDNDWLAGLAATLYPLNADREPREAARVAFVTLDYELPGMELEEPWMPPPRPAPGRH
jgi:hypothetical protein